jgi:RNA polymerase sigma factor (sigma-70 family)
VARAVGRFRSGRVHLYPLGVGEDEFTALFHALSGRLFSFAAARLSAQAADDAVSQTFETVWDKRAECPSDPTARIGWVFTIGRYKILQELDRRSRKHHDHRFADDYPSRSASQSDVSETVAESDLGRWIYGQLTAQERDLFDVAFMKDVSRDEAAAMLAISVGTFNTRVSRLRSRIRALHVQAESDLLSQEGGSR